VAWEKENHGVFTEKPEAEGQAPKIPPVSLPTGDDPGACVEGNGPEKNHRRIRGLNNGAGGEEKGDTVDEKEFPQQFRLVGEEPSRGETNEEKTEKDAKKTADAYKEFTISAQARKHGHDVGHHGWMIDITPVQMFRPIPVVGFVGGKGKRLVDIKTIAEKKDQERDNPFCWIFCHHSG